MTAVVSVVSTEPTYVRLACPKWTWYLDARGSSTGFHVSRTSAPKHFPANAMARSAHPIDPNLRDVTGRSLRTRRVLSRSSLGKPERDPKVVVVNRVSEVSALSSMVSVLVGCAMKGSASAKSTECAGASSTRRQEVLRFDDDVEGYAWRASKHLYPRCERWVSRAGTSSPGHCRISRIACVNDRRRAPCCCGTARMPRSS